MRVRAQEDYNDHLDAMAMLSKAKLCAIEELYERIYRWKVDSSDLNLFPVLDAYATASGAWSRVMRVTYE